MFLFATSRVDIFLNTLKHLMRLFFASKSTAKEKEKSVSREKRILSNICFFALIGKCSQENLQKTISRIFMTLSSNNDYERDSDRSLFDSVSGIL